MISFFKPNSSNKGAALTVSFNQKGDRKGIFFELIKQVSWDDATKKGKFSGGAKILTKLSTTEAAYFIDCIEKVYDFEKPLYHTTGDASSTINFKRLAAKVLNKSTNKWEEDGSYKGFLLQIYKGDVNIGMGLTWAEAIELREYLKLALREIFYAIIFEEEKRREEYNQSKQQTGAPEASATPAKQKVKAEKLKPVEEFVPEPEEDENIPF